MSRPSATSCSIFVGNVPYDAQEDELRELFAKVGNVTSVRLVCDKDTRQPKGYAFCDFSDSGSVQIAIEKLNNVEYNGRKLRIDWAERELHTPAVKSIEDRATPRASNSGVGAGPVADLPPVPVPTVADRLARLRDQEAAEQARVAAAEAAERAEIARLMETLTPQQVIHILGEMQRLTVRAPEVARALVGENLQLALALQHAEFLAGLIDEPPLPTEPEVKERARSVREKIWGPAAPPPAPPAPSQPGMPPPPAAAPPGLLALPGLPPGYGAAMVPFGAPPPPPFGPPMAYGAAVLQPGAAAMYPLQPQEPRAAQRHVAPARPPPPELARAFPASAEQPQNLLERLVQLSPAEIDRLPHHTKIQLLEYLQTLPTPAASG